MNSKKVYGIYAHRYGNRELICLVSSKKKAIIYCTTEGRTLIPTTITGIYPNSYGKYSDFSHSWTEVLSYEKIPVE